MRPIKSPVRRETQIRQLRSRRINGLLWQETLDYNMPMPGNSVAHTITKNRVETLNSFEFITDRDVENDSSILVSDWKQHTRNEQAHRRFELMCKRKREAKIAHEAGGTALTATSALHCLICRRSSFILMNQRCSAAVDSDDIGQGSHRSVA